jgi:predicted RNA-binding Zn-ribbon protein involved in translation (DUF1610 family)
VIRQDPAGRLPESELKVRVICKRCGEITTMDGDPRRDKRLEFTCSRCGHRNEGLAILERGDKRKPAVLQWMSPAGENRRDGSRER